MTVVALVGFMGAGTTAVGRAVANRLGWQFADLDDLVQAREACTIEKIFAEKGEQVFREIESAVLRETIAGMSSPVVLALGGGTFCQAPNQELLREALIPAVFLDAPVRELFLRSEEIGIARPLRRDLEQFRRLYEQRRPDYLKSALRIETSGKDVATVVHEIVSGLEALADRGVPE